ncbi:MAG: hypothetical protein ACM3S1_06475 [Hyphomicrobiales bacterium]
MSRPGPCAHLARRWGEPAIFDLEPALPTTRSWRYADLREVCADCGQWLAGVRVDLRGDHPLRRLYRVIFGERVREGTGYRLQMQAAGPPLLVLNQSAGVGAPVFDVEPPIPCTEIDAAYEDDVPFALIRRRTPS